MGLLKSSSKQKSDPSFRYDHKHEEHIEAPGSHDESNWLVSYADMMTLLCGFFIMLFTMSKLDEPQYEKMKEAVSKEFKGAYKNPSDELKKFATQVMVEAGTEGVTSIKTEVGGVSLTFNSSVFYETASAEVLPAGKEILSKLIDSLQKKQTEEKKEYRIVVEGHTDSRPIVGGVYPSNWELSSARATSVIRHFMEKGFSSKNMIGIGYADTHPDVQERTPAGSLDEAQLAKNRRVVIKILDAKMDSIPIPQ